MNIKIEKINSSFTKELEIISKWFDNWYEWPKPYWTQKRIYNRLIQISEKGNFPSIFVAKCDGVVAGTLGVDRFDTTRHTPKYYPWIVNGYVDEKYRKKGIYKKLLDYIYKYMFDLGYDKLYIRTDLNDIYEKLGWTYIKNIKLDNGVIEKLYEKKLLL